MASSASRTPAGQPSVVKKRTHVVGRQEPAEFRFDQQLHLVVREREVRHPDLPEPEPWHERRQGQRGVLTGGDNEVNRHRRMLQQVGHHTVDARRVDAVVVVEDDHDRLGEFIQLVREFCDQYLLVKGRVGVHHPGRCRQRVRAGQLDRSGQVRHEQAGAVDGWIQRQPGEGTIDHVAPLE